MYQLYFLVTMNYDNYDNSLRYLDSVLRFFEENNVFDEASAMLLSDLSKVILAPYNLGLNEILSSKFFMANNEMTAFVYEARVLANQRKSLFFGN